MAEVTNRQETRGQAGQGQEPETVRAEAGCCLPMFPECGPDTCGLPLTGDRYTHQVDNTTTLRRKIVKLTSAGAQRLFNGEDDEIYTREDLIEKEEDRTFKVIGACSGTVWLVQKNEIEAIVDA